MNEAKWAWLAKDALAYWRHKETGSVSSRTAAAVLDDHRDRGIRLPYWVEELAHAVIDYEARSGTNVHVSKDPSGTSANDNEVE